MERKRDEGERETMRKSGVTVFAASPHSSVNSVNSVNSVAGRRKS
jgi:hypothetical protein